MAGMLPKLLALLGLRPRTPDQTALITAFFGRYAGHKLIVHAGLEPDWLKELLKTAGGGGIFRYDRRQAAGSPPAPIEYLVGAFVLPLALPLPLLLVVGADHIRVRHLVRDGRTCHPTDINWILDDMARDEAAPRVHAILRRRDGGLAVERGIPVEDNAVDTGYGFSL